MKTLLNSNLRDAVRTFKSDCPLLAYVRKTYTPDIRGRLNTFRPSAEDVYCEIVGLLDEWKNCEDCSGDTNQYAYFDSLLATLLNDYRDMSPNYSKDDCLYVAQMITAMLITILGTQRTNGVAYYHLSSILLRQLYTSLDMDDNDKIDFIQQFAANHSHDIASWLTKYLTSDEWISDDIMGLDKGIEKKEIGGNSFRHIIQYRNPDALLARLHELIDGRQGADVGSVLLACKIQNYITRNPKEAEFRSEFPLSGKWSAVKNYMSDNNQNALDRANKIVIFD